MPAADNKLVELCREARSSNTLAGGKIRLHPSPSPAAKSLLGGGVNRRRTPAFGPRVRSLRQPKLVRRVGEQLDEGLPHTRRDVHDDVAAVKLAGMRQTACVSDHLKVPLQGKRVVAH